MGTPNVAPGAVEVGTVEFNEKYGELEMDQEAREAANGDFGPPDDFDGSQVPEIIRAMNKPKRGKLTEKQKAAAAAKKAKDAEKKKAAAQKEKDRKLAERDEAKRQKEADRAAAKDAKKAAKDAGPDLTGLVSSKQTIKPSTVHVAMEELDGIDGGDPVDKSFVEAVRLAGRVLQPILVRREENGRYNIIAGKRRAQAVREIGWPTIPATLESRDDANDNVLGLQENMQRSENVIEQHRMVMNLYGYYQDQEGMTERKATAAIVKATGMTPFQVKRARDVGRLDPALQEAVETGAMTKWSALNAARLPQEAQARLVDTLQETGRVTADDVKSSRSAKQAAALGDVTDAGADQGMFDNPDDAAIDPHVADERAHESAIASIAAALDSLRAIGEPTESETEAIRALTEIASLLS